MNVTDNVQDYDFIFPDEMYFLMNFNFNPIVFCLVSKRLPHKAISRISHRKIDFNKFDVIWQGNVFVSVKLKIWFRLWWQTFLISATRSIYLSVFHIFFETFQIIFSQNLVSWGFWVAEQEFNIFSFWYICTKICQRLPRLEIV